MSSSSAPASSAADQRAEAQKERGNAAFRQGNFEEALESYTAAIKLSEEPTLFSNRSQCLIKLERFEQAAADAKKSISLDPNGKTVG